MQITVVGPLGIFKEFVDAIKNSLKDVFDDINVVVTNKHKSVSNPVKFDKYFNIVILSQTLAKEDYICPNNGSIKVLIQTEQNPRNITVARWDRVLTFFKEDGKVYFPIGYSDKFVATKYQRMKGHDKMFFGAKTAYRQNVLKRFGIKRYVGYGDKRNSMIKHSNININIKAYDEYYFAPLHAIIILCQGKLVLQESCNGDYDIYKPYIKEYTIDTLSDVLKYINNNKTEILELEKENLQNFKNNLNFEYELREALKGLI